MFIGFYNYTVVLTYMSLLSSVIGNDGGSGWPFRKCHRLSCGIRYL